MECFGVTWNTLEPSEEDMDVVRLMGRFAATVSGVSTTEPDIKVVNDMQGLLFGGSECNLSNRTESWSTNTNIENFPDSFNCTSAT